MFFGVKPQQKQENVFKEVPSEMKKFNKAHQKTIRGQLHFIIKYIEEEKMTQKLGD